MYISINVTIQACALISGWGLMWMMQLLHVNDDDDDDVYMEVNEYMAISI